jgi:hypothetical protein
MSLLAEHEVTHVLGLVREMAEKMGIADAYNPELDDLAREIAPEAVLDRIDHLRQE